MSIFYPQSFTAKQIRRQFIKCSDGVWRIQITTPISKHYLTNRDGTEMTGRTIKELRYKYYR